MKKTVIYDLLVLMLILGLLVFLKVPYLNLLLVFIVVLTYSKNQKGIGIELGFSKPKNLIKIAGLSLFLAMGIVLISYFILLPLIQIITELQLDLGMFKPLKNNPKFLYITLISGWIVGGLFEETIFRGFIISKFINHLPHKTGAIFGIIFSSVIFGYLHTYQGPTGQILNGIVGLIFGIVFVVNGRNLWLNILTHGFVNTISMLVLYSDLVSLN
ncbi:CPBP family intramembrane glutamic endopeptidase [Flagellimonas sp. CMM7]|uniref:CPBP family intramembrane glutamic endopeptidase n=1 Tax=Flagellimonas sp. CMM7 TaxID=2654676 RepID=UPI0013D8A886|nr:CPBP family intramembrane glutamic endopeptidase [Flagellimonas sp. CMM7]UII81063.1 CPBP family intramembrane metalloprotease [Flagellimonas sp. CMM7]